MTALSYYFSLLLFPPVCVYIVDMKMDQVDTLRASRVSVEAHVRSESGSFSGGPGARLSKDGWFTGPGGASSTEVLNALRLESVARHEGSGEDNNGTTTTTRAPTRL